MAPSEHRPHPHWSERRRQGPVKVTDQLDHSSWYRHLNSKLAVKITAAVGSMTCAWLFCLLAIAGLPTALKPGNIGFLFWFSSDLLQLTLLSVIIVGQNIQAGASDKRAEQTFLDVEALLHELNRIKTSVEAGQHNSLDPGEPHDDLGPTGRGGVPEPPGPDGDPDPHRQTRTA